MKLDLTKVEVPALELDFGGGMVKTYAIWELIDKLNHNRPTFSDQVHCPKCAGTGQVTGNRVVCLDCGGKGLVVNPDAQQQMCDWWATMLDVVGTKLRIEQCIAIQGELQKFQQSVMAVKNA
jgi:RecJ-like exonuclease